eukprot:scaffold13576_cov125-Isochrysis_galbana.AAC.3
MTLSPFALMADLRRASAQKSRCSRFSTRSGPTHCFFLLFAIRSTAATTGPGMATGDALRCGQAAIRRSDRRTHLGDVTAHWATAARGATLTSAWSCLADMSGGLAVSNRRLYTK